MPDSIRILIVEDLPTDAELAQREISKTLKSCVFQRVETREAFLSALDEFYPDLIISDYRMPRFDGLTALKLTLEKIPLTPVIILTGAMNEDTAVECLKAGANNYVIKEHIKRLGQAVVHALEEKKLRQERLKAEQDLKESEERYRTLVHTLPDSIVVVDTKGNVVYASPSTAPFLGYNSPDELIGRNVITDWIHPNYRENAQKAIEITMTGDIIRNQEYLLYKKDGSACFGEVSASCMKDGQGKVIGIIAVVRDISQRKQAEEERAQLETELQQAQKMESVGRLAGGVAHDFNNMLSVILGYAELVKSQLPIGDPLVKDMTQIERAGERARDVTRQLLAFSRKQIIEPRPINVNDQIAVTQKTLVRLISEEISLNFYPQKDIWKVKFDPSQLDQILINLAVNARDAMPNGGALTIRTSNISLDEAFSREHLGFMPGDYVLLTVSDTGIGMDKETLEHAFEPFFTTKAIGKGTGLGLATVYGIVKQSGGFIDVESEPQKGTTFRIYLPRLMEEDDTAGDFKTAPVTIGHGNVLVVEDDEMVRKLTVEILESLGYKVLAATTPKHALSLFEKSGTHIDLLITDVVMPGLSGVELKDKIEEINKGVKVLFMSGYASDIIAHRGVLDDGVNFIRKPFSVVDLARAVQEVLHKR